MARDTCTTTDRWTRERVLFALAGTMALVSATLVMTVSPWFAVLTAAVGLNQLLLVATGSCPASLVVDRVLDRP